MDRPNECRWCGCDKVWLSRCTVIVFDCGSSWSANDGLEISTKCLTKCADLAIQQRDRIQRALKRLETATRFELVRDEYGAYMKGRDSWGNWLDVIEVEQAIAILKGEADGKAERVQVVWGSS